MTNRLRDEGKGIDEALLTLVVISSVYSLVGHRISRFHESLLFNKRRQEVQDFRKVEPLIEIKVTDQRHGTT